MINRVVLVGRIATDPSKDLRYTGDGVPVVNFRIAVNRRFSRQDGDNDADFFTVVAWRQTAEFVSTYLEKGRLIAVDGRLQERSYQTREGDNRRVVEVVADSVQALDRRPEGASETRERYEQAPADSSSSASSSRGRSEEFGVPPLQEDLPDAELDLEAPAPDPASSQEQEEDDYDPFADPFGD